MVLAEGYKLIDAIWASAGSADRLAPADADPAVDPAVGFPPAFSSEGGETIQRAMMNWLLWVIDSGLVDIRRFGVLPYDEEVDTYENGIRQAGQRLWQATENIGPTWGNAVSPLADGQTLWQRITGSLNPPDTAAAPLAATPQPGQLDWFWACPRDGGLVIIDYSVRYRRVGTTTWTTVTVEHPRLVVTGLTNGVAYEAQVRARNAEGLAPDWSPAGRATPQAAVPSGGNSLSLRVAAGNARAVLSWLAAAANGAPVTGYRVQWRDPATQQWSTSRQTTVTGVTATVTGLTNGVAYQFRVAAVNSVGVGPWSNVETATPTAPAATAFIPDVAATPTGTAGNGRIRWAWASPSDNGSDLTGLELRFRRSGTQDAWTVRTGLGTIPVREETNLVNGTEYEAQVRATNSVGTQPTWGPSGRATPQAAVPDRVQGACLSNTSTGIRVQWGPPEANGAALTAVTVQRSTRSDFSSATTEEVDLSGTATSTVLTGLTEGVLYYIRVRAVNSRGNGGWSPTASLRFDDGRAVPAKPATPVAVVVAVPAEVTVAWATPAANGADISGYETQHRLSTANSWSGNVKAAGRGAQRISGLTAGQSYQIRVRARNAVGAGAWSDPVTVTVRGSVSLRAGDLGDGAPGAAYSQVLPNGTGGSGRYTHTVTGLPAGLSFDAATRTVSGTLGASTTGDHDIVHKVVDVENSALTATATHTLSVFSTLALPAVADIAMNTGRSLSRTLPAASGGSGTYVYSLTGKPSWISLSGRVITGTAPASPTTVSMTWTVTDSVTNQTRSRSVTVNVYNSMYLSSVDDQVVVPAAEFSLRLPTAQRGSGQFTYTVADAPSWVTVSGRNLSGTAPSSAKAAVTVTYTATDDETGQSTSRTFTITVASALALPAVADIAMNTGRSLSRTLPAASGGSGTYVYSLTGKPSWISLSGRVITGTAPASPTTVSMTWTVTDSVTNQTRSRSVTVNVYNSMYLSSVDDQVVVPAAEFSLRLPTAQRGSGQFTYTVADAPSWVTVSGRNLSGTAPSSAKAAVTVTYTATDDETGQSTSRTFTITVASALALPAVADIAMNTGRSLSRTLPAASGGSGTYVYSLTGKPSWISLSGRVITGTAPASPTTVSMTWTVTDSVTNQTRSRSVTVNVYAPLALGSQSNILLRPGNDLDVTLPAASGGSGNVTYALSGEPDWVSRSGRALSGTAVLGSDTLTWTATDSVTGESVSIMFTLATVVAAPGPPTNVGVTISLAGFAGRYNATISWTPPSDNGGAAITGQRATFSWRDSGGRTGSQSVDVGPTANRATVTFPVTHTRILESGTAYVRAKNSAGFGDAGTAGYRS